MQWAIWAFRLLLTPVALISAATLGLSTYWWVIVATEPLPEEGAGWAALGRGFELIEIGVYFFIPSALGLLLLGPLTVVAWPRPWRKVLLFATLWAVSVAFMVCALAAGFDWSIIPTVASLLLGWGLYRSIQAAIGISVQSTPD